MMKRALLLLLFGCALASSYGQTTDETAIQQLLEKESATWRSGDVKGHADCWLVRPYSKIWISLTDGSVLDISPEIMINPPANAMGKGGTSSNANYKFSVMGNSAWVSHDEVSTSAQGVKSYSHEIRILEKTEGQWKLVGQSIHAYKPK